MARDHDILAARQLLEKWRRSLEAPFAAAKASSNNAEMARLQGTAGDIDDLLDELAFIGLGQLAASLDELKRRVEAADAEADQAALPLAGLSLAKVKETLAQIFAQSSEESPPPAMELVAEEFISPTTASPVAAPAQLADNGRLILTEAHLIALWKRSQFPIDGRGIIVFGLRGCRPVDVSGTDFLPQQELVMKTVNYKTMNCTIGQWRPGAGIALFPGSTVPFGTAVESALSHGGMGVNQLGRGRYVNYVAGWHKRAEGSNGHWALLQECPITLQRTIDNEKFDNLDRWEAGQIAGDNIHCAFNMGQDTGIPDTRFSSAGCQTIAGMVRKGVRGSEVGPWKRFIAPFKANLGSQKSAEYVLLDAEEVQAAIRTQLADKSVVLRMGRTAHGSPTCNRHWLLNREPASRSMARLGPRRSRRSSTSRHKRSGLTPTTA